MNLKPDCLTCLLNQSLRVTKSLNLDEKTSTEVVQMASASIATYQNVSPPVAASDLYPKISEMVNKKDLYRELKALSTIEAMKLLPKVENVIQDEPHKLKASIKASVAGNVIDFATPNHFELDVEFEKVFETDFAIDNEELFLDKLKEAKSFMIVGDNVGEHIFDKLLLEVIGEYYPHLELYYAVRGEPIINDVTLTEAKEIGIDKVAILVDSGVDTPGLAYTHASEKFMKLYNSMDLIIAKGMGNYECLEGVKDERIFHLFKVKCDVVSKDVGASLGSLIFMQNRV